MAAIGEIGYGAKLKGGSTAAAITATVALAGISNLPPPAFSREKIDVTHTESPDGFKEYIPGMSDPGDVTLDLNWVAGNATDDYFLELQSEKAARLFEILFTQVTPNRTCTFRGFLTGYEPGVPVDGKMTATVTLAVTGKPVWAEVV